MLFMEMLLRPSFFSQRIYKYKMSGDFNGQYRDPVQDQFYPDANF